MLLARGYKVRAFVRDPQKAQPLKELGAEIFQGDLRQPETITRACKGAEKVISSVCAPVNQGDNNPRTVDQRGNRLLIDAARSAGAQHFVFVSGYSCCSDHPVDFFRIKYQTEEYLKASGLSYTILRPTLFMEFWGALVGAPVLAGKKTMIFGGGSTPLNFISAEDVAKFILLALEDPRLQNQSLDIGGPQNLTLNQVAELYGRVSGKPVRKQHMPAVVMSAMSRLLWPIQEGQARIMAMGAMTTRPGFTLDMTGVLQRYPVRLISLEEVARKAVREAAPEAAGAAV